jgi:hypothetical protein
MDYILVAEDNRGNPVYFTGSDDAQVHMAHDPKKSFVFRSMRGALWKACVFNRTEAAHGYRFTVRSLGDVLMQRAA